MPGFDPKSLQGLTCGEAAEAARRAVARGDDALEEAKAIYEICLSQDIDLYLKGKIRQEIWQIEKKLGRYHLYLSQAGQDRFIHQTFFKTKRQGVFVEIGAYNGWVGSNCFFFEKIQNWRGVLVEASPRLLGQIAAIRSGTVVHAAICDRDGTADFIEVSSGFVQMGGLADHYEPGTIARMRNRPDHREAIVSVPTMRLDTLLTAHDIRQVDYCSIDVEGAERAILSDFDFQAFDLSVISLENNAGDESRSLADILKPAGYRLAAVIGVDEIWAK